MNDSDAPIIWLDSLDGPLIRYLQLGSGDPYPTDFQDLVRPTGLSAVETGPIRPSWSSDPGSQPAPHRYPWQETRRILDLLAEEPGDPYDAILVHYRNPRTGGWTLPSIGCGMQMLRPGEATQEHRHTSTTIYHAFRGRGRTIVDGEAIEWEAGDSFVVPLWCTIATKTCGEQSPRISSPCPIDPSSKRSGCTENSRHERTAGGRRI